MTEELLPYYNQELEFLRLMGAEFAEKYPKIAARLHLSEDGSHDPHVERIVEAFAYLNARIRYKLDDDFPEIVGSLLGVLYPHYQNPIPSMAIVQFKLDDSQATRTTGHEIARGTFLDTESVDGETCRYQTCYPTTVWPFKLESASLSSRPFQAPATPKSAQAETVVRLQFSTRDKAPDFSQLQLGSLRFYLYGGQARSAYSLYELLFNNTIEIALATSAKDSAPVILPKSALIPVGFGREEGMVPYSARSFPGYRLLSEYFTFPEKFLFCEISGLTPERMSRFGNRLEIYLYLDRAAPKLENKITEDNFRLGCTPVVNLFPQHADSFQLTQQQTEYRIVPDARRVSALEVYSIDRVEAVSPSGDQLEFVPFYSLKHGSTQGGSRQESQQTFWQASRKPGSTAESGRENDSGTEMYLSLVDLGFNPTAPADWTLIVETTCLNRDLPGQMPFGGGRPRLELVEGMGPISSVMCLTKPTATLRPILGQGMRWRLLSHLSLNHLSLSPGDGGVDALKEILKLYDFVGDDSTKRMVEGILRVESQRVVGRSRGTPGGVCQGLEVSIHFDEEKFSGSGLYLFASVLDRFLGMYATINSFSRLVATCEQRRNQGDVWRWPARAGERPLL